MSEVSEIKRLLSEGKINPKDRRHAAELVANDNPQELTQAQLNWLSSLAKRGGEPFVKP